MRAVLDDYRQWRGLGRGGLPANPIGWLVTTSLRPFGRDTIGGGAIGGSGPDGDRSRDFTLPRRKGSRPSIAPYPIPHRELGTAADPARIRALADHIASFARGAPDRMYTATSRFERRGDALFVRDTPTAAPWIARSRGEVAHVHGGQGSLHVVADPDDVPEIIGRGWGERHPLAGRALLGLPDSYLLLYSPRDDTDLLQIKRIVDRVVQTAR